MGASARATAEPPAHTSAAAGLQRKVELVTPSPGEPQDVRTPDFDALYRSDPDPYGVRSTFYEQRHLALLVACLTRPTYASAWDPSCGVGELAAALGGRADRVLATDASAEAVRLAAERCAAQSAVTVQELRLPDPPSSTGFDLVVLSEFFYYLPAPDREASLAMVCAVAAATAELVAVHWRPKPHDAWLSGADVQTEITSRLAAEGWRHHTHHDDPDFVLDVLRRGA